MPAPVEGPVQAPTKIDDSGLAPSNVLSSVGNTPDTLTSAERAPAPPPGQQAPFTAAPIATDLGLLKQATSAVVNSNLNALEAARDDAAEESVAQVETLQAPLPPEEVSSPFYIMNQPVYSIAEVSNYYDAA
ncbi:MAG: hypothetical protein OXR62_15045 [Ahrensia sp.]|nr:hypothetical protein [Ahrensia sp.]